jgi:alkane 1-monooxygenase
MSAAWNSAKAGAFSLYPVIPLLAPVGYYADAPWLSAAIVFIAIPLLDLAFPNDRSGPFSSGTPRLVLRWLYWIPQVYIVVWSGVAVWALVVLRSDPVPTRTAVWLLLSFGLATSFATCAAHELLHWPERLPRALARLVMATVAYGHFPIEHVHHHATVGLRHEGTTPPLGQSVWSFLFSNAAFSFSSAWRIERKRQQSKGLGLLHNRFVQQWLLTGLIVLAIISFAGGAGLLLFLLMAAFGIYTTEYVNYAQHYGLARTKDAAITGEVSWSSNGLATNALTLNITRHAHHHVRSGLRYYELEHVENVPMLPAGYLALFFPAMIPAIWRGLMDDRAMGFLQATARPSSASARTRGCIGR